MKSAKTVFDYSGYKLYLRDRLAEVRGSQGKLAAILRCHSGYLSQVLRGSAHLSQEQAIEVNRFLNHSKNAGQYFVLLVSHDRAGSQPLRDFFQEQMKEVIEKQKSLKTRLRVDNKLSDTDKAEIYSSWHYVALHIAVMIPKLRSVRALSQYFGLPQIKVRRTLEALTRMGLIRQERGEYLVGPTHVHLPHDSPMINAHHTHWRMKAIQSLDQVRSDDLHYSSVVSMSRSQVPRVREILMRAIEEVRQVVRNSESAEVVHSYCIDWFGLEAE